MKKGEIESNLDELEIKYDKTFKKPEMVQILEYWVDNNLPLDLESLI